MDPLLKKYYLKYGNVQDKPEINSYDIYKADIYSLGISFFKILSGQKSISNIYKSKKNLNQCQEIIHKLNSLPLIIKQTIISMIASE